VTGLKRVRVGELRLGKLAEGEWRFVKPDEFRHRRLARQGDSKKSAKQIPRKKNLYGNPHKSSRGGD